MRRRVLFALVAAVLALAFIWTLRTADKASALRTRSILPEFLLDRPLRDADEQPTTEASRDFAIVSCTVANNRRDAGSLVAKNADGELVIAKADDRTFSLSLAPGEWTLTWLGVPDQLALGTLDLSAGDIQRCHLASAWEVTGHVQNRSGRPVADVWVGGCGGQTTTDQSGQFRLSVTQADCEIVASFQDGGLQRRSEVFPFTPFDESAEVELELDDGPIAGIGIVILEAPTGVLVEEVREDTPAEDAGLQNGDLLVAVDGKSTEGWNTETAMAAITGEPGTIVHLDIRREDENLSLSIRRERM